MHGRFIEVLTAQGKRFAVLSGPHERRVGASRGNWLMRSLAA